MSPTELKRKQSQNRFEIPRQIGRFFANFVVNTECCVFYSNLNIFQWNKWDSNKLVHIKFVMFDPHGFPSKFVSHLIGITRQFSSATNIHAYCIHIHRHERMPTKNAIFSLWWLRFKWDGRVCTIHRTMCYNIC